MFKGYMAEKEQPVDATVGGSGVLGGSGEQSIGGAHTLAPEAARCFPPPPNCGDWF